MTDAEHGSIVARSAAMCDSHLPVADSAAGFITASARRVPQSAGARSPITSAVNTTSVRLQNFQGSFAERLLLDNDLVGFVGVEVAGAKSGNGFADMADDNRAS